MKPFFHLSLLVGLLAATAVSAADGGSLPKVSTLTLGGAASSSAGGTRLAGWGNGNLVAGVAPLTGGAFNDMTSKGMQTGGFLAWQAEDYRVDASLTPSLDGSIVAGLGAAVGAKPGQPGTSYGLRLGAAWLGERFTVNPASGLGLSEVVAPTSDVNLTFTVNHALTPNLSVIGTAAARRPVGNLSMEGATMQGHFLVGAGLGYRF
ncbi:hypothetical protein [Telmatospirillum siberiense]|uniref:Outer membrane protein beta-barrel domain-containing protein n=1 Tax=Telmatospirillum siberiense TaxID=382514 RepID=A0A2N3PY09_9PROT|nr:hypothetical protein [Telmatospirillum siberiense]PKU25288.1 hypothetical protein CWS72_06730 [Telmatospirillum siberiense]